MLQTRETVVVPIKVPDSLNWKKPASAFSAQKWVVSFFGKRFCDEMYSVRPHFAVFSMNSMFTPLLGPMKRVPPCGFEHGQRYSRPDFVLHTAQRIARDWRLIGYTLLSATHRIALGQFALIMRPHSVLVAQEGTES